MPFFLVFFMIRVFFLIVGFVLLLHAIQWPVMSWTSAIIYGVATLCLCVGFLSPSPLVVVPLIAVARELVR